jgi:hypothetical protein
MNINISHNISTWLVTLLFIIPQSSMKAQQAPSNTNIAGPSASATGSVVNQAVQVLQGPYATNTYGAGISCQGPTMSLAPFALGSTNYSQDPTSFQTYNANFGFSMGFNFPLDGSLTELCKQRVRTEIERQDAEAAKARLDFELVRLIKCGEAKKQGIDFHPYSPYAKICADIIVQPPKIVTFDPVNSINNKSVPPKNNGKINKQR